MRTCKEPDCGNPVRGRGMCVSHYSRWYRRQSTIAGNFDYEALALKLMPGTYADLAQRMGVVYQTAFKIVRRLHTNDQAHIGANQEPDGTSGSRWQAIFHAGPGVDLIVTAEEKRAFWKEKTYPLRLESSARSKRKKRRRVLELTRPTNFAGLLAPLMNLPSAGV